MRKYFWGMLAMLLAVGSAEAGTFRFEREDASGVWYEYTGYVLGSDYLRLREVMNSHPCVNVFITINSGGGSAFGGIELFDEAEKWDNLITIAGKDYGAWSAAAIFWCGSPRDWFEGADAKVGFHQAYCDSVNPPGCNLSKWHIELVRVLNRAGYSGPLFDWWLDTTQQSWGVEGWALLTDEGWFFYHSGLAIKYKLDPFWEIK